jgi:hypothetical protein
MGDIISKKFILYVYIHKTLIINVNGKYHFEDMKVRPKRETTGHVLEKLVAKDSNGFTIPRLYLGSHL